MVEKTFLIDPRASISEQVDIAYEEIFVNDVNLRIHCPDEEKAREFKELLRKKVVKNHG